MPRFRHLRLGILALSIALIMLLGAALPSHPTQPAGEVLGVVARAPAPLAPPLHDPRFVYARATDRPVPLATLERMAPAPEKLTGYVWPLARGRLTLPFKAIPGGSRIKDGKLFHDGIDVASFCGDTVRAAHDGVVLAAGRQFDHVVGWVGDLGPYYRVLDKKKLWDDLPLVVVINDGNGYRSVYAHFSKVTVAVGDRVKARQKIGLEGMTGHASGCHVHYGLFSPFETDTFGVRADILKSLRLPQAEIARIDPLIVMPRGAEILKTRRFPAPEPARATEAKVPRN